MSFLTMSSCKKRMYVTYIRFFNALTLHKSASHDNCATVWAARLARQATRPCAKLFRPLAVISSIRF